MTASVKRQGRGALSIMAGLLVVSAILRIGSAGEAVADVAANDANLPMPDPAPQHDVSAMSDTNTSALLEAFQQREARLIAREAQLADRLQALRVAEVEVTEQLAALQAAEETLSATIALADAAAETDIGTLVAVYENMKPKDAAALFEQMTPEFAAGFLGMMNAEAAAQIMTLVPPDTSYSISVVLAGRNANVPTE